MYWWGQEQILERLEHAENCVPMLWRSKQGWEVFICWFESNQEEAFLWLPRRLCAGWACGQLFFSSGYTRSGNTLKKKSWVNQGFHIALLGTDVCKGVAKPRGSKLFAHLQQDKTALLNASASLQWQGTWDSLKRKVLARGKVWCWELSAQVWNNRDVLMMPS